MKIQQLNRNGEFWDKTIDFAEKCTWRAGAFLAKNLRNNVFVDWERVFIAHDEDQVVGYCSFTEKDCITSDQYSPFIGFIFVDEWYRGKRVSQRLINGSIDYAKEIGFKKVYIASGESGLYEKYGFIKIDEIIDKYGNLEQIFCLNI